ncbi:MAG: CPBP family glutamic-type intramembrane protease [Chloroflexota bacterium]
MLVKLLYLFVPYLAVGLGLFIFHNTWVAILTYHAAMAAVIFLSKRAIPFKQVIRTNSFGSLILPVAIGAGGGLLLYLLWPLLSVPLSIDAYLQNIGLTATIWPYFIVYYVLVNPVLEEYYWRGYLGSSSNRPVFNDFLFAGYHLIVLAGNVGLVWLVVAFVVLCAAAWYWRQISRITGGLLATTLSHTAADITVILTIYFMVTMS